MKSLFRPFDVLYKKIMQMLNKNYLKNKLDKRQGSCKKCGECCKGCRHLDKTTKLCKIYDNRHGFCYKEFPLDEFDQKIWNIKNCGYKFE